MSFTPEAKMQFLYALRSHGVTETAVLQAMEKIDRGAFVKGYFTERAYEDMPLPIPCGQTISQPSVVALMTQALRLTGREKVLEVGTGSGYQAAVLSRLARRRTPALDMHQMNRPRSGLVILQHHAQTARGQLIRDLIRQHTRQIGRASCRERC